MTAPTWEEYMAPALRVLFDGEVHRAREVVAAAADGLDLSLENRAILIPSGQEQWVNRGTWALSYLARAGAVERPARGHYRITEIGRNLVAQHAGGITERDLREIPGYTPPRQGTKPLPPPDAPWAVHEPVLSPVEQIETGIDRIEADVAADLLKRLHDQEPAFFEQAVLDLLIAMGYGGAEGRATRTQLSNDGGVDGVVDQDALGLSQIYVQAKRYAPANLVGRPAVQGFVGALHGNQANQGVFITSGRFSSGARDYADSIPSRVVLIDGDRLARLMIRYGVGVQVKRTIHIVEIDEDFFQ